MDEIEALTARIKEMTGWKLYSPIKLYTDTSQWMNITRGDVMRLGDTDYVVKGNAKESRFGIEDQPKTWVFNVINMNTGESKIIKTVFYEEFDVRITMLKIHCYRSPKKEARVLDLVKGDMRFMQGFTQLDDKGNHVRVLDIIRGDTIFNHVASIKKPHEQYFQEDLPGILWKLKDSIESIQFLHQNKTCHGDIRNDHIYIDRNTGLYRWIDFDLTQDVSDFDIWSLGNILSYITAKGIKSFHQVLKDKSLPEKVRRSITADDASAFYEYRIMNLKKLFPYIPPKLDKLLLHFTVKPLSFYSDISQFVEEYNDMLDTEFPQS